MAKNRRFFTFQLKIRGFFKIDLDSNPVNSIKAISEDFRRSYRLIRFCQGLQRFPSIHFQKIIETTGKIAIDICDVGVTGRHEVVSGM